MNGLPYGNYRFTCRLEAPALLPDYKGSTFRGVFGLALKKVVCALKQQECTKCVLRHRCLYTRVFETHLALSPPTGQAVNVAPHPFVIEPPDSRQREFAAGEEVDCTLLLFGPAVESLPYFIYAFEQIGRIGIGKRINGRRAGFRLQQVQSDGRTIFSHDADTIEPPAGVRLSLPEKNDVSETRMQLKLTLETPLRLKFNNRFNADLPFHVLVRAILRRVSALFACYVGAEPALDYKGLLKRAAEITTVESRLHWHGWKRYSNRQKQRMPLGGMVGDIVYEGKLGEFLPLMDIGTKVHIGKNTSFGLGKFYFSENTVH